MVDVVKWFLLFHVTFEVDSVVDATIRYLKRIFAHGYLGVAYPLCLQLAQIKLILVIQFDIIGQSSLQQPRQIIGTCPISFDFNFILIQVV